MKRINWVNALRGAVAFGIGGLVGYVFGLAVNVATLLLSKLVGVTAATVIMLPVAFVAVFLGAKHLFNFASFADNYVVRWFSDRAMRVVSVQ